MIAPWPEAVLFYTVVNVPLAPADSLKREIQSVLSPELSQDRYRNGHGRYDGYGYIASEAYFHLAGGQDAGLRSIQLTHAGKSHWWLLDQSGRVIDLSLEPGEGSAFPYDRGQPCAFRWTPAGISRRAQTIIERVMALRSQGD